MHWRGWGLLTLGQGPAGKEEAQAAQIWASGVLAAKEAGHAGAVEDGVNAGEALVSSFMKQGIEQQEEGSGGAGGCWWPDSATRRGQTRSWRRSGRGGEVHGAGALSVLAHDTQAGGGSAIRRTERGKEK